MPDRLVPLGSYGYCLELLLRHTAKRRRLETVMQEIIYRTGRLIEHEDYTVVQHVMVDLE